MARTRESYLPPVLPDNPKRRAADGRIIIREFTPTWPTVKTAGGIEIPTRVCEGQSVTRRNAQGQDELVQADKSVVYGVVTGCGLKAERGSYSPMNPEKQGDFPLPDGTLVRLARTNEWVLWPDERTYNCCDLIEYVLPSDPRPVWAPKE